MVNLTKSPAIGSSFTTLKSGVTGIVREVDAHKSGVLRVRLELPNGESRWTSIK